MAADFIENYKDQPLFQFIKDVPVDWKKTCYINGEIGEFITTARKDSASDDWYLGSITNEKARDFSISLDFLDNDKKYIATIYKDGQDAHWDKNPTDYVIEEILLEKSDNLHLKLASGGGTVVRFKSIE